MAAVLTGIAAGNARSGEVMPDVAAAPAGQTSAPATGITPDRYPPRPGPRGYAEHWPRPSQWPAPPPGYGQQPPYYPPYGQYRTGPDAPIENPLSTRLEQTQAQLAAQSAELETTRAQLARLQADLENATAALQKAQSDTINAGVQIDNSMTEVDTLRIILCELATRIEARKTLLHDALQTTAAGPDDPDSTAAGEVAVITAEQVEPQADPQCAQLTPPPVITSGQRGMTVKTPAR
jgi:hypothetical protein